MGIRKKKELFFKKYFLDLFYIRFIKTKWKI